MGQIDHVNDTSLRHYNRQQTVSLRGSNTFHLTKTGTVSLDKVATGVPYKDKTNIARWKTGADTHDRGNVWFIPYPTVKSAKPHPAAFPFDLPLMCIKDHGYTKNTVVLDPFMGSGTTALAAQRLGCAYIGSRSTRPNPK
jgi:site-specific DNA-methyltransferase (adenine-specific)